MHILDNLIKGERVNLVVHYQKVYLLDLDYHYSLAIIPTSSSKSQIYVSGYFVHISFTNSEIRKYLPVLVQDTVSIVTESTTFWMIKIRNTTIISLAKFPDILKSANTIKKLLRVEYQCKSRCFCFLCK